MSTKKKAKKQFVFLGKDNDHSKLSKVDGTLDLSHQEKFALICELTLFDYQLKSNTNDLPRLLRTTASIRKA